MRIEKDNPMWESLYRKWLEEKKPGWLVTANKMYQVFQPDDESVFFEEQDGGIDKKYSSLSVGGR